MRELREVLRLRLELHLGYQQIGRYVRSTRHPANSLHRESRFMAMLDTTR